MRVCFGGSFNPPTKAHLAIINYLAKRYQEMIIVPNGNRYERKDLIPFNLREAMLKLMISGYNNIVISDYETKNDYFLGTVAMLKYFNHPLFVIGADNLLTIKTWINYQELVKQNQFLVFPRDQIDSQTIIKNDTFFKKYQNHFQFVTDFEEIKISSTDFRSHLNENLITDEVLKFIKDNNLYEVNSCITKNS